MEIYPNAPAVDIAPNEDREIHLYPSGGERSAPFRIGGGVFQLFRYQTQYDFNGWILEEDLIEETEHIWTGDHLSYYYPTVKLDDVGYEPSGDWTSCCSSSYEIIIHNSVELLGPSCIATAQYYPDPDHPTPEELTFANPYVISEWDWTSDDYIYTDDSFQLTQFQHEHNTRRITLWFQRRKEQHYQLWQYTGAIPQSMPGVAVPAALCLLVGLGLTAKPPEGKL